MLCPDGIKPLEHIPTMPLTKLEKSWLKAIEKHFPLRVVNKSRNGHLNDRLLLPDHLEDSEKDDKFQLIAKDFSSEVTVNLGRIVNCEQADTPPRQMREVEFEVTNQRKAL